MNDEHDLDPIEDARVRALLADLGSAGGSGAGSGDGSGTTMPPEVAARLEETLAQLVTERAAGSPVVPPVVHLRRRWVTRAAAAAAAVVVLGAGGVAAANLHVFGGGPTTAGSASSAAGGGNAESATVPSGSPSSGGALRTAALPELSSSSFTADVSHLLARSTVQFGAKAEKSAQGATPRSPAPQADAPSANARDGALDNLSIAECSGPAVHDGSQERLVRYDGRLAVLLVHPPSGGVSVVDAWTCTGGRRLDSTHVPAAVAAHFGQGSSGASASPGVASPSSSP